MYTPGSSGSAPGSDMQGPMPISDEALKAAADAYGDTVDQARLRKALEAFIRAQGDRSDWPAVFGPSYSNPDKGAPRA